MIIFENIVYKEYWKKKSYRRKNRSMSFHRTWFNTSNLSTLIPTSEQLNKPCFNIILYTHPIPSTTNDFTYEKIQREVNLEDQIMPKDTCSPSNCLREWSLRPLFKSWLACIFAPEDQRYASRALTSHSVFTPKRPITYALLFSKYHVFLLHIALVVLCSPT